MILNYEFESELKEMWSILICTFSIRRSDWGNPWKVPVQLISGPKLETYFSRIQSRSLSHPAVAPEGKNLSSKFVLQNKMSGNISGALISNTSKSYMCHAYYIKR